MKIDPIRPLTSIALALTVLSLSACGTRTEVEKTTVIERKIETPEPKDGHLQRAGEKIDEKVDRKIDEAIDESLGE